MKQPFVKPFSCLKVLHGQSEKIKEFLVEEKYISIYLDDKFITTLTCTPCNLEELAIGFLFDSGHIKGNETYRICIESKENTPIKIKVNIKTPSSQNYKRKLQEFKISTKEINELIISNIEKNRLGKLTHGTHACSFWKKDGLYATFIDVKRHNAIDKLVGSILLNRETSAGAFFISGRLSSEIINKCAKIGIPILISKGTTTTLGIQLARKFNITLVCYARPGKINIFNKPERIVMEV